MHAILVSVGTDGDIYPYLGLGARLRARGHRVTLVANEHFRALTGEHGLTFRALVSDEETQDLLANPDFWHPLKTARVSSQWGARFLQRQYALLAELASDGDTVLAASPGVLPARVVQDKLARPLASIVLQPWLIPSVFAPPVMPGGVTLPRWAPHLAGKLYWRLWDYAAEWLVGRPLNRLRASLDLKPVRRIFCWWLSPELVIGMFPNWYGPPQADWPPQMRLAGFPLYDGRPASSLSCEVREFCGAGEPPIAFTFGTGMMHAADLFRAVLEACSLLGKRGLLLTKYRGHLPEPLPSSVRHVEYAPFKQLLPLCAAVVHHGGVGTVAKALAAGTPQLILPFAFDQADNAVRIQQMGVGDWLKPRQRSGTQIAKALNRLMVPATQVRCRAVAARLGSEDALENAAQWLEELAHRRLGSRLVSGR
jgi:rhamnosyltransferase subunit B